MQYPLKELSAAVAVADWRGVLVALGETPPSRELLPLLYEILDRGDFEVRWALAKFWPKIGADVLPGLIALLQDEGVDGEIRWFVARYLGDLPASESIEALATTLSATEIPELIEVIGNSLSRIGGKSIEVLGEMLAAGDRREVVARALSRIRTVATIEPLIQLCDDGDATVRQIAVEALGSFHDPRVVPILLDKLADLNAVVRRLAIDGLAVRDSLEAQDRLVDQISPLLNDWQIDVSKAASRALGRLKTGAAVSNLFATLAAKNTPLELQRSIIRALGWIDSISALAALTWGLTEPDLELETIATIGRTTALKTTAAAYLVEDLYRREGNVSPEVAIAYANAWRQLGDPSVIEAANTLLSIADDRVFWQVTTTINQLKTVTSQT